MKIPRELGLYREGIRGSALLKMFEDGALELIFKSGIFIEVVVETVPGTSPDPKKEHFARIYFKVMQHEFEGLDDLKKAVENKVFL